MAIIEQLPVIQNSTFSVCAASCSTLKKVLTIFLLALLALQTPICFYANECGISFQQELDEKDESGSKEKKFKEYVSFLTPVKAVPVIEKRFHPLFLPSRSFTCAEIPYSASGCVIIIHFLFIYFFIKHQHGAINKPRYPAMEPRTGRKNRDYCNLLFCAS